MAAITVTTVSKPVFSVEGPIGVGKTAVLRALEQANLCKVFYEPIEQWKPALTSFYQDQTPDNALMLQDLIGATLEARHRDVHRYTGPKPVVMERSQYSGLCVFTGYNVTSFPDHRWLAIERRLWNSFRSFESNICRIALHHDDVNVLLQRTRTRESDAPELSASVDYLKAIYERSNVFENECQHVVNVSSKSVDCVAKEIEDIIFFEINK